MGKYDIGKRFQTKQGEWFTIINKEKNTNKRTIKFDDCDNEYVVYITNIARQNIAHPSRKKERHGERYTKLWREWNTMLWRCNPKNTTHRKWYYDKGISVCDEWHSYLNFKTWALSNGYKDGLTIDRIDSDFNYCPTNCQWITLSENVIKSNIKSIVMVDLINYRTQLFQSIADTARYFRCNEETIRRKLKGISIKRIPLLNDYILLFYADDYYNA
jgi:hypothetical protein